jgi:predicted alpha-1,2-mannosidase
VDGFHDDFTPTAGAEVWYVEGDGAQYTWFVPHDLGSLFTAMGGPTKVVPRLDAFFAEIKPLQVYEKAIESPFVYMGNEPSFATPWAYNWAGAPWKTQEIVRRVLTTLFRPTPTGLEHNDDLGTLSSWYVWGALGMYPAIPPVGGVALAGPLFPEVVLRLPGGDVRIHARGARAEAPYVQALTVDGKVWTRPWLPIEELLDGAELGFEMGTAPNEKWGSLPTDAPPSFPPAR